MKLLINKITVENYNVATAEVVCANGDFRSYEIRGIPINVYEPNVKEQISANLVETFNKSNPDVVVSEVEYIC